MIEIQCPNCRSMMEAVWDTEWTDGRQRTVDMLCPNCLHRETVFLKPERKRESDGKEANR